MSYQLSGCVFVRDTFRGAFCLFESLHQLLPVLSECLIMDLGSTDGTLEVLQDIAHHNPKVKLIPGEFSYTDAGVFATLANELVALCSNDRVLYWQSDEIWHEDLVQIMRQRFEQGDFDLSFWRIQYRDNFQKVKWFPHLVHRVGEKPYLYPDGQNRFHFDGDGMNTNRVWDAKICSNYGGEYFPKWGDMGQDGIKPYVNEMITDISLVGAFRDNIPDRRRMHAPFWHEEPTIEGKQESHWYAEALSNDDWIKPESPYNLPDILRWHVGRVKYELRQELLEALYVL